MKPFDVRHKNFINIFYRLAMKLVAEGKKDSALRPLDKAFTVMPKENVAMMYRYSFV